MALRVDLWDLVIRIETMDRFPGVDNALAGGARPAKKIGQAPPRQNSHRQAGLTSFQGNRLGNIVT